MPCLSVSLCVINALLYNKTHLYTKTPNKVFFFVGINFHDLVKNYKFVDSKIGGFCACTKIKFVDFIFSTLQVSLGFKTSRKLQYIRQMRHRIM